MNILHPALETLLRERPTLKGMEKDLQAALDVLLACFRHGGKLLLCGNGGSACDCEHIAGELMKGFLLPRPLTAREKAALAGAGDGDGAPAVSNSTGAYSARMFRSTARVSARGEKRTRTSCASVMGSTGRPL